MQSCLGTVGIWVDCFIRAIRSSRRAGRIFANCEDRHPHLLPLILASTRSCATAKNATPCLHETSNLLYYRPLYQPDRNFCLVWR